MLARLEPESAPVTLVVSARLGLVAGPWWACGGSWVSLVAFDAALRYRGDGRILPPARCAVCGRGPHVGESIREWLAGFEGSDAT